MVLYVGQASTMPFTVCNNEPADKSRLVADVSHALAANTAHVAFQNYQPLLVFCVRVIICSKYAERLAVV